MTDNRIQVGDIVNLHHARDGRIVSTGHKVLDVMDIGGVLFAILDCKIARWIPVTRLSKVEPSSEKS